MANSAIQTTVAHIMGLISQSHGRIFTAHFVKRSTGELRRITCRTEVNKYLRGGAAAYDPAKHDTVVVCDMALAGRTTADGKPENPYRSIALEGLLSATIAGQCYEVEGTEALKRRVARAAKRQFLKHTSTAMGLVPRGDV